MIFKTQLRLSLTVTYNVEQIANDEHIPHKLKSAGANTQQFKLKLVKMTVYILQIEKSAESLFWFH